MRAIRQNDGAGTALLLAVYGGRTEDVECLLAAGADVNLADKDGLTPLMASAMNGSIMIARLLLDAGADPSMRDKWHLTARTIAESFGHSVLVALFGRTDTCCGSEE